LPVSTEARVRSLCSKAGFSVSRIEPLAGDVGSRRYFRGWNGDATVVAVQYPEGQEESCRRWNRVREAIAGRVRVPEVLAEEDGGGMQVLEDLGSRPLSSLWSSAPSDRARRHADAARAAAAIAATPDPGVNPPFSADFFFAEMEKSREAFFGDLARDPLSADERSVHDAFARSLAEEIAGHPRVLLHRDFHVDNLFETGEAVGVIDFQDARLGPDSYDMASLVGERAALVAPDPEAAAAAIRVFRERLEPAAGFRQRLSRVALQRGWKAAGTFAKVCAQGRAGVYGRFLAPQLTAVEKNLSPTGVECEFTTILRRRSAKLFGKEAPC
jgi:aminoglycoside/choline kinase family phosphotransferase